MPVLPTLVVTKFRYYSIIYFLCMLWKFFCIIIPNKIHLSALLLISKVIHRYDGFKTFVLNHLSPSLSPGTAFKFRSEMLPFIY